MKITVLLPVYNGEKYLAEAINSILTQTLKDFELLIINDGSTDKTSLIIGQFKDKRIRTLTHKKNLGLVTSLNEGISAARGEYIARMDSDDVSLPTRFEEQLKCFEKTGADLVATRIITIDSAGKILGSWQQDESNVTMDQIKKYLPKGNCLAHPSIMINAGLLKKYKYSEDQPYYTEDYDLWLRLVADGYKIAKVNKVLLKYRVYSGSKSTTTTSLIKATRTRLIYLKNRLVSAKFTKFDFLVVLYLIPELRNSIEEFYLKHKK